MADLKKLAEQLTGLTVLEVNELGTILKDEYGIEPAAAAVAGLGLGEAKALVDGAPKTIKEKAAKDEAEAAKKTLEEAGATVELA
jgi:large subunit ribosomal protein L7/L12